MSKTQFLWKKLKLVGGTRETAKYIRWKFTGFTIIKDCGQEERGGKD